MQDISALRFAGDVQLNEIKLRSLNGQVANVAAQIVSIEIYEDIFSPFMTMSLVLRESVDYINLFPFVGEEFVDVDIVTPGLEKGIAGSFYVYKITDRIYTKDREVVYTIKAISEEWLTDSNRKLSQTFKGDCSEIAHKLMHKTGINTQKNIIIEKTANKTAFTSAFWTPTKCLNLLCTNSMNESQSASYLFYENRHGFNFRSIDELLKVASYSKFTKDNYTRSTTNDANAASIRNLEEDFNRIIELDIPTLTDYMEDIQSGRLKSRIISHDLVTKQYHIKDFNIKKDTKNPPTLLNKNQSFSKYATANSVSTMIRMGKHFSNFNSYSDVTNYATVQQRLSFFQNLQKYKVNMQVFGRTDYTIGQVMELNIPRATQISKTDNAQDEILSGRYLLSAVSHVITRENHTCNMELIKNSIITDLAKL